MSDGRPAVHGCDVCFVIYQTGAGSNGGLVSISEIVTRASIGRPRIVTNIASDFSRSWEEHADVLVWPMAEGGSKERRRPFARALLRIANNVRLFFELRRSGAKVVHINDRHALWNAAFGARLAGAWILFNVRDGMREGASRRRWRFYLRMCDSFLVLSQEMEVHWRQKLAPLSSRDAPKFRHLYSSVDRSRFHPAVADERSLLRARLGVETSRPALLYAGRVEEKKAQIAFIREALPEIARVRPDAVVYFVGDFHPSTDPYAAACRQVAYELGLDGHAHFAGYSPSIADWYRAADLVLLASVREGLARCMIEGIACGTPVLSFAVCSAREILEGHGCGAVVPRGDYAAFARAALGLLDDDAARAAMATRGPEVAAELFDPDVNAGLYTGLVDELTRRAVERGESSRELAAQ